MSSSLFTILFILLFASCVEKSSSNKIDTETIKHVDSSNLNKKVTLPTIFDSSLTLFSDNSYKLTLHVFDTESYDEEKNNSTVTFRRNQGGKVEKIFQDSFYCMHPLLELQDFNNDKIKDVLFFYYTGGRANPTYHLYLVDTVNHKLIYVNGFENLPNPDLDTENNIITSVAMAGADYIWDFYRINSQNKLTNLGHGFEADLSDTIKYDHAIKQILKEGRK